jgi:hypothetical protein
MAAHSMHTRVFLSAVSAELAQSRLALKRQFADAKIDLVVQDDFLESGNPKGTLVKIFDQIDQSTLVLQLIGPHPSQAVPAVVCEETLDALPDFKRWLHQSGLVSAFRAGRISYVEFEGYTALYLKKAFLPVRYRNGAQPDYEDRMRRLGRHVEFKLAGLDALLPIVQEQLRKIERIDRQGGRAVEPRRRRRADWLFAIGIGLCLGFAFLVQLARAGWVHEFASLAAILPQLVSFTVFAAALLLFQFAVISDELQPGFKLRTAARNGSVAMAIFSVLSAAVGYASQLLLPAWQVAGAGWMHWAVMIVGAVIIVRATQEDSRILDQEIRRGTSSTRPGGKQGPSHLFWTDRQTVMEARRVDDLGANY